MSLDRFLAVGYPLQTKHLRTPRAALGVTLVIWLLASVASAPPALAYTVRVYEPHGPDEFTVCADYWGAPPHGSSRRAAYYLGLFIVTYVIPVSLIGAFSTLTVRRLWIMEATDGQSQRRSHESKRRVTRLIVVVVVVFALCWLPSHVIWLWTNFFPDYWQHKYSYYYFRLSAHILSYANSSMNPVIYAFLSSQFRRGFRLALRCPHSTGGGGGEARKSVGGGARGSLYPLQGRRSLSYGVRFSSVGSALHRQITHEEDVL